MVKNLRIWLGGSFDPVHLGHLAIVEHIADVLDNLFKTSENVGCHSSTQPTPEQFNITLSLLPTARNPLKPNPTENFHRLAMLALGLEHLKQSNFQHLINFQIDISEIYQTDTVFTFNTFTQFRQKYPHDSLIFVLGMDSILAFKRWYRAYELPNLCHLWVMPRETGLEEKNGEIVENLPKVLQPILTENLQDLILTNYGRIYLDKYSVMAISSSHIRAILQDKAMLPDAKKLRLQPYLSPSVLDYIFEHNLYHA